MMSEEFVKRYYNYIKEKARQFLQENTCFDLDSKMKAKYFASLEPKNLISQLENLQSFFRLAMDVKCELFVF